MTAKRFVSALLALLLSLSLTACGSKKSDYRDDVSAASLSDTVSAIIPVESGYDLSDDDFLTYHFEGNTAIDDYVIAASSASSDVNEYGILHVNDPDKVEEIRRLADVYLTVQRDFLSSFLNTYNAAEMDKLDQMSVKVFGNYVVYTILSKEDTAAVHEAVEEALKQQ